MKIIPHTHRMGMGDFAACADAPSAEGRDACKDKGGKAVVCGCAVGIIGVIQWRRQKKGH